MKFTINSQALYTAVSKSSAVTPTRAAALVAYTGILFEVADGQLSVTGSDGEVTVSVRVLVQDSTNGKFLVAPKRLVKWLANVDKTQDVSVVCDSAAQVSVSTPGGQEYKFKTMVAAFPAVTPPEDTTSQVALTGLKEAVAAVRDAADEAAPGTGTQVVQLVGKDGNLYLYATDRLRLSQAVLKGAKVPNFTAIVEVKALEMADRLGSTGLVMNPRTKVLELYGPDHNISVRVVDVDFPPVEMILATPPAYTVEVSRQLLKSALDRLSCVSDDTLPLVVTIEGASMELKTESVSVGGGLETVSLPRPAASTVELGVNLGYFQSAVNAAYTDTLTVGWSSPVLPLFISSVGTPEVVSVVMPIRLGD